MTGCAWRDVISALEAKGIEFPRISSAEAAAEREEAAAAAQAALRRAKQLYAASAPVVEGDPVQRYLEKRHLWPFLPNEDTYLRCTRGRDAGEWLFMGVIVDTLSLGDVDQRAVGAQIMPLDVRGNWKTDDRGKKMRRIIGTRRAVGVPLGKPCETLVVGEGIETTMAALRALGKTFGIAALSAENMSNLLIPEFVRKVTIAQDNDAAGRAAAERCAPMWRQQGLVVRVASFGDAGMDAADWLAARKSALP